MNQTIQFPDREWWEESIKAFCFPAMVNGFQIICAISGDSLIRHFGNVKMAKVAFRHHRHDLETEEMTKAEREDDQGRIWLS